MIFSVKSTCKHMFWFYFVIINYITDYTLLYYMSNDSEKSKIRKKPKQNCRADINEECISYLITKVLISPANLAIYRPCK